MTKIKDIIKKLVPAGSDGEDLLIPLSAVISALQQTNRESICHCYDERHSFGEVVESSEACWDGFVRIFDRDKIVTITLTPNGTDEDKPITLGDCLAIAKNHGMDDVIYVIFDDWLRGDMYVYNKYFNDDKWRYYGRTLGFA